MDYLTKIASREQIRELSVIFRKLFGVPLSGPFPVLTALEKIPDIFPGSSYTIIPNEEMSAGIPAQCRISKNGTYEIMIRQSTYDGAYQKNIGAFRDHIVHEMCHAFLYSIGYTPVMSRSFKQGEISNFCSSEWQAKALCGEVMMPYKETADLDYKSIAALYGVSPSQAYFRKRY